MTEPPLAVCFDLDGTIVDFDLRSYSAHINQVCVELATVHAHFDAARLNERHMAIGMERWITADKSVFREPDGVGVIYGHALMRDIWRSALAECGSTDEALVEAAHGLFWDGRTQLFRLFDDTLALLDHLHGRTKLAVITNGPSDFQRDKLEVSGIDRYFDLVVASGDLGLQKPDPAIFQHVLDTLCVPPERAWHIGDNLAADVGGARNAGMTAVWLNRDGIERPADAVEPDIEVRSLRELIALLRW